MAPLAVVHGNAPRHESRGRPAFPAGHQPAHRARLAVHRRRRRRSRMALLRGRGLQRQEPLVDRHARRRAVPAARQFPHAPGQAGKRHRVLPPERRRLGPLRAGESRELHRSDEPAPGAGRRTGRPRRGVQPRLHRRHGAGRTRTGRPGPPRHRPEPLSRHRPARCRTDARGNASRARGFRETGRAGVRDTAHAGAGSRLSGNAGGPRRRRGVRRAAVRRHRASGCIRGARRRPFDGTRIPADTRHERLSRGGRRGVRAPPYGRGGHLLRRQYVECPPRHRGHLPRDRRPGTAMEPARRVDGSARGSPPAGPGGGDGGARSRPLRVHRRRVPCGPGAADAGDGRAGRGGSGADRHQRRVEGDVRGCRHAGRLGGAAIVDRGRDDTALLGSRGLREDGRRAGGHAAPRADRYGSTSARRRLSNPAGRGRACRPGSRRRCARRPWCS